MTSDDTPRGTNPLVWLVGILAVGTAALFGVPKSADQPQATKPAAEAAKEEKKPAPSGVGKSSEPLQVLRDHLRVAGDDPDDPSRTTLEYKWRSPGRTFELSLKGEEADPGNDPLRPEDLLREPAEYELLIAGVPDPVDSKFPHEFDAVLDGIQRAYEARNFTLRASRLPWPHGRKADDPPADPDSVPRHWTHPGVLLFRKTRGSEDNPDTDRKRTKLKFALVLLVGESPISGMHKRAMRQALDARHELDRLIEEAKKKVEEAKKKDESVGWAHQDAHVKIIAPYFSGSQPSLILAIREWWAKVRLPLQAVCGVTLPLAVKPPIRIINGSATALNVDRFEEERLPIPESTVVPDALVTQGIISYLNEERGLKLVGKVPFPEMVAILRESNTALGVRTRDTLHDTLNERVDTERRQIIELPFPSSISQLHVERERGARPLLPQSGLVEPKLPVRTLTHLDAIPPYDAESAATTAGLSLRMILTVIRKAPVRYVGIVATDTRDVVFLNQLIRAECPDVRVFTTEPGAALLHPEEAYHLRGMVVGSTYPLDPIVQYWARTKADKGPGMIPFPTQGSQGYYNAVLAHHDKYDRMLGYRPPAFPGGREATSTHPPVWISVVGHNGRLVPVRCYPDYAVGKQDPSMISINPVQPGEAATWEKPAVGVPVAILVGSLAAVAALVAVILAVLWPHPWQKLAAGLTPADDRVDHLRDPAWVWVWRGVVLAGVLLFVLPYTLPAAEAGEACCRGDWRHHLLFVLAILLVVLLGKLLVLLGAAAAGYRPRHPGTSPKGYLALTALVVVAGAATAFWWLRMEPSERFFVYVRTADPGSGLSPVVPMGLLAAAAIALGWFNLRQADLARREWLTCPYRDLWGEVQSADERLRAELRRPLGFLLDRDHLWVTLGLVVPVTLWVTGAVFALRLPSGEGGPWDWTMRGVFWATAVAVVLTLARFLAIWNHLKALLREILRVPMVAGFERLPHEVGRMFGGYLYSQRPHRSHLAAAAWALPAAARSELSRAIEEDKVAPRWVFGTTAAPKHSHESDQAKEHREHQGTRWLACRLGDYAREFLGALPREWGGQTTGEAYGEGRRKESTDEPQRSEVEVVLVVGDGEGGAVRSDGAVALVRQGRAAAVEPRSPVPTLAEKEDSIAAYVVLYLGAYFAQLRMLACAAAAAASLLLFADASYAFQPHRPVLAVLGGLVLAVAAGTLSVFYQINKDGLVSRISRTTPDRFTPDVGFLSSVMTYVVPLLTLAVLQFLGLFRFVVEPILGLSG